ASPVAGTPEGTPGLGIALPPAIGVDLLANALVDDLPTGRVTVRLENIALSRGQELVAGGDGPQVLVVESRQVPAEGEGWTGSDGTGTQIAVPPGAHVTVRNPGPSSASLLRLLVRSSASAATPSSIRSGTPTAVEAVPNVLVAGEVPRLAGRRG